MADEKKSRWTNRTKKTAVKAEGEGIKELTDKKRTVQQGQFRIAEKTFNEEKDEWEYKFEWDQKFAEYAKSCCDNPEEVTKEDMDAFCLNILVAKQVDELEDGIKVNQINEPKENKTRFYKKYK